MEHVYKTNYILAIKKQNSEKEIEILTQRKERAKLMRKPKRKYTNCLATRLISDDYTYCLQKYSNPQKKYEKYKLVPNNN
mgnify:CR=1 FL=1